MHALINKLSCFPMLYISLINYYTHSLIYYHTHEYLMYYTDIEYQNNELKAKRLK